MTTQSVQTHRKVARSDCLGVMPTHAHTVHTWMSWWCTLPATSRQLTGTCLGPKCFVALFSICPSLPPFFLARRPPSPPPGIVGSREAVKYADKFGKDGIAEFIRCGLPGRIRCWLDCGQLRRGGQGRVRCWPDCGEGQMGRERWKGRVVGREGRCGGREGSAAGQTEHWQ